MDLSDVLYIIDGKLEVLPCEPEGYEAVLYDNIHDPCRVLDLPPEPNSEWRYGTARAKGSTPTEAIDALAKLLAGRSLSHSWPVMWKSYDVTLHIPPTLTAGTPKITPAKAPEPTAASA